MKKRLLITILLFPLHLIASDLPLDLDAEAPKEAEEAAVRQATKYTGKVSAITDASPDQKEEDSTNKIKVIGNINIESQIAQNVPLVPPPSPPPARIIPQSLSRPGQASIDILAPPLARPLPQNTVAQQLSPVPLKTEAGGPQQNTTTSIKSNLDRYPAKYGCGVPGYKLSVPEAPARYYKNEVKTHNYDPEKVIWISDDECICESNDFDFDEDDNHTYARHCVEKTCFLTWDRMKDSWSCLMDKIKCSTWTVKDSFNAIDWGYGWDIEFRANAFLPSSGRFRKIYSKSIREFQVETTKEIYCFWAAWANVSWLSDNGQAINADDKTRVSIVPISFGLKYFLPITCHLNAYFGLGLAYAFVDIKDNINSKDEEKRRHSDGGFGGITKSGLRYSFDCMMFFDLFADYQFQRVRFSSKHCESNHTANLSGWKLGGGIGYLF